MSYFAAQRLPLLLVDSDDSFRRALQSDFTERGFEVVDVPSYERAMLASEQYSFSLAIVDIRLSGRSGFEVLRELRDRDQSTTLIVLTASPTFTTALEAGRLGASAYFAKPSSVDELLTAYKNPARFSNDRASENGCEPVVRSLQKTAEEQLYRALSTCGGNVTQAARLLGISRRTLHRKLQQHPDLRNDASDPRIFRDN